MEVDHLINIIKDRNDKITTPFYDKALRYLESIKNDGNIQVIPDPIPEYKYVIEAIKLYFVENFDSYRFVISNNPIDRSITRKIQMSEKGAVNLWKQIHAIKTNNVDSFLSDGYMIYVEKITGTKFYFNAVPSKDLNPSTESMIEITDPKIVILFLGITTFDFLEHQNMERFMGLLTSNKPSHKKSAAYSQLLLDMQKDFDSDIRERVIVFSGYVFQALGTINTSDIDIIYNSQGSSKKRLDTITKIFRDNNALDHMIYDDTWENARNMKQIICDPTDHFYFLGIKLISPGQSMQRAYRNISSGSYVDLLMLKEFNNYDIDLCLPHLVMVYGTVYVYDKKGRDRLVREVVEKIKNWHGINMTYQYVDSMIRSCNDRNHDAMITNKSRNHNLNQLGESVFRTNRKIIDDYFNSSNNLVFGSNGLRDLSTFVAKGVERITVLETSEDQITRSRYIIDRSKQEMTIDLLELSGSEIWGRESHKDLFKHAPYQNMMFDNSIQFLDIDRLIENVKKVESIDTIIGIIVPDGPKIRQLMGSHGRYEIREGKRILFGVYQFDSGNSIKIAIYINGTYRYDKGSVESLVDPDNLIRRFGTIGYRTSVNQSIKEFDEISVPFLCGKITELFRVLVLRKGSKDSDTQVGGKVDFLGTYLAMKHDYMNL